MRRCSLVLLFLWPGLACAFGALPQPEPPRAYLCARADTAPSIDGQLDDAAWRDAAWTEPFTDIEGALKPAPEFKTTAAMRWDDEFFYFAFRLEEPHLQASFRERDSYIYQQDNDIEIFIDPDGDNHLYAELELNALNTVWDLLLIRPYRDGGPAVHAWDMAGLRTAVHLDGTLNDPADTDRGWTVEVAIPWDVLGQIAGRAAPPAVGDIWRVNFSRVQWDFDAMPAGGYTKTLDPRTGQSLPEHNWVWSPQGRIAMHMPENWGEVMFVNAGLPSDPASLFAASAEHRAIALGRRLMRVYHGQRRWHEEHGTYTANPADLDLDMENLQLVAGPDFFRATLRTPVSILKLDEEGRLSRTQPEKN